MTNVLMPNFGKILSNSAKIPQTDIRISQNRETYSLRCGGSKKLFQT